MARELSLWPEKLNDCTTLKQIHEKVSSHLPEEQEDLRSAINSSLQIDETSIEFCMFEHEREWMREVNEVALRDLIKGKSRRQLTSTSDYLWTQGRQLMGMSSETLHDPKPDFAFGLRPYEGSAQTEPLSKNVLNILHDSPRFGLTFSPSQKQDIVYPGIIYEGKSDTSPIVWAENLVAVGVARALALLQELNTLSGMWRQHCVLAITSAGPEWKFHIACRTEDDNIVSTMITSSSYLQKV